MKKLALIGNPAKHSLSPAIHNFMSRLSGQDYEYESIEIPPERLSETVEMLKNDYAGFNITSPYKQDIMGFLDGISDEAKKYGAVNTVVNKNGSLYGYNTDADGFCAALVQNGIEIKNKDILVLGVGGAAKSVIMKLSQSGVKSVTVCNRTAAKAEEIAEKIQKDTEVHTKITKPRYDLIINSTILGMGAHEGENPLSDMSVADKGTWVYDMIYAPSETVLLKEAKKCGAKTANGLGMLVNQAVLAYELFTGVKMPEETADLIFKEVLK